MNGFSQMREKWTARFGTSSGEAATPDHETVILVPPTMPVRAGFRLCHERLSEGATVRLIARGATIERNWPAWVLSLPGPGPLFLTELDCYLPRDKGSALASVLPSLERWLDETLAEVLPGVRASTVFWSSAMERLFNPLCEAWLLATVLAEAHGRDSLECLDPSWICARVFEVHQKKIPARISVWRNRATMQALGAGLALAGVVRRVQQYVKEAPTREKLQGLRHAEHRPVHGGPTTWIGLLGDWPRANRSVEIIPPLMRDAGESLGVLLLGSLSPGLRKSAFWHDVEKGPVLPSLDAAELDGVLGAVDQGLSAENVGVLGRVLVESLLLSQRSIWNALRRPLTLNVGDTPLAVALPSMALARFLSMDVLRAREAWHATHALLNRRDLSHSRIVLPHATGVNDSVVDQLAQATGATTVEMVHGLSEVENQLTSARSSTTVKAMWSIWEADAVARYRSGQEFRGGYFPRPRPLPVERQPLRAGEPIPVLVASSYLNRAWGLNPHTYELYQEPLMKEALLAQRDRPLLLRWRPHPGDDPDRIQRLLRAYPSFELSTADLDTDLRWCRALVSSVSSVTIEALWYELPIFVHDIPRWDESMLGVYDPLRRFGLTQNLSAALAPCLDLLLHGDEKALAPEVRLRNALFGPGGQPRSLAELLWPDVATTPPTSVAQPLRRA